MKRTISKTCSVLQSDGNESFNIPEFMEWLENSLQTYASQYNRLRLEIYTPEAHIIGERDETDAELKQRLEYDKEYAKKSRHEQYLKLKKEFEPE